MVKVLEWIKETLGTKYPVTTAKIPGSQSEGPTMPIPDACFFANVSHIRDGDTQEYLINIWHGLTMEIVSRLLGVDTREVTGPQKLLGLGDKQFTLQWIEYAIANTPSNTEPFVVKTEEKDKYGRWLSWVWRTCDGRCLNTDLLINEHGTPAPQKSYTFILRDLQQAAQELQKES